MNGVVFNKYIDFNLEKLNIGTEAGPLSHLKDYRLIINNDALIIAFPSNISPDVISICFNSNYYNVLDSSVETLKIHYGLFN